MSRKRHGIRQPTLAPVALALVLMLSSVALAQAGFEEKVSISAESLRLANLIGEIRIEAASGGDFEVEVSVQGRDASRNIIGIEVEKGHRAELAVTFPVDAERRYVYPRLGRSSSTRFEARDGEHSGGFWSLLTGKDRIEVSGGGRGLEVWADVTVRVPAGAKLEVQHGVGEIAAERVEAELQLAIRSGQVTVTSVEGDVVVDTGSGHVEVRDVNGDLNIDTGSGHVEARRVRGDVVVIDTGSGRVDVEDIRCAELSIDTGSGGVSAAGVEADEVSVDTGSGSVSLALTRMGPGDFDVDTGSGRIDLELPGDASARVRASTGSGRIQLDIGGARVLHEEKDEVRFEIGNGAARVFLETGSGGIRIASR